MNLFLGLIVSAVSIIGGYLGSGGHLAVLWQPFEFVIIIGSAIGSYIISNPKKIRSEVVKTLKIVIDGSLIKKKTYVDTFCVLFLLFKKVKAKGLISIENDIEQPEKSNIFKLFPAILKDTKTLTFLCDNFRMIIMGNDSPYQIDETISQEIESYENQDNQIASSITYIANSLPALGIVAAVLGVIHTMSSINESPEVLGKLIGAALVGTFLGVLIAYTVVWPYVNYLKSIYKEKTHYYSCIQQCVVAFLHGAQPMSAIEYGRKIIDESKKPTFIEVEKKLQKINLNTTK